MSNCQTWMAIAEKREAELKAAREQLVHDSELCEGLAVDCKASRQLADRYKAALDCCEIAKAALTEEKRK